MTRLTVTLWTCGRCGKPRGLRHACAGRRNGRDRAGPRLAFTCPSCGSRVPSLLAHTCAAPSDFRRRKAARARAEKAAERKRRRRASAARKRARAAERRRQAAERRKQAREARRARARAAARRQTHDRSRHEYADCTDPYCDRTLCRVYREGIEAGRLEGRAAGFAEGYAEGMGAASGL